MPLLTTVTQLQCSFKIVLQTLNIEQPGFPEQEQKCSLFQGTFLLLPCMEGLVTLAKPYYLR